MKNAPFVSALLVGCAAVAVAEARVDEDVLGPVLSGLTEETARVWGRITPGEDVAWTLKSGHETVREGTATTETKTDGTFVVVLDDLDSGVEYTLEAKGVWERSASFRTPEPHARTESARIAFGSCSSHDKFDEQPIWTAIGEAAPTDLVLLGDTPYIDSTDLAHQRLRYREFWSIPELAEIVTHIPVRATWDDHDYATNDHVGPVEGRENSRRAFVEYHGHERYGDGTGGVYSKFRRGPVEVFVLDTRWFGYEDDLESGAPSLLGHAQRQWLIEGVKASEAPIKVLCCGMVWNGAVRPGKKDHWGTFPEERELIFREFGDADVTGVVLVSGDIHRPRVIRHVGLKEALGYAPIELVSTPLANHPIAAAAESHPGLVWDDECASVALTLEVRNENEQQSVSANFLLPNGDSLHSFAFDLGDLAGAPEAADDGK